MFKVKLVDNSGKFENLRLDDSYYLRGNKLYLGEVCIGTITAEEAVRHFEIHNK